MKTLNEVVEHYKATMSEVEQGFIIDQHKNQGVTISRLIVQAHMGGGRMLRNALKLWHPESADLRADIWEHTPQEHKDRYLKHWNSVHQGRTMHADDASTEILRALFTAVCNG